MGSCVQGREVGVPDVVGVGDQVAHHLEDPVGLQVQPGTVLAGGQRVSGKRCLGEQRHLDGQAGPVLIPQFQRDDTGHVAAGRVAADADLGRVDPLRGGIVEQPAHDVLDLLDLGGVLGLGSQLVVHDVGQDPGPLGDQPHRHLELIQGAVSEPAAVDVDQRAGGRAGGRAGSVTADRDGSVRARQDQRGDGADRWPGAYAKLHVIAAARRDRDVGTEGRTGRQPCRQLRVQRPAADRVRDIRSVIYRHFRSFGMRG